MVGNGITGKKYKNKQQRMKDYLQTQNFLNTFCLLSCIAPPAIPDLLSFDFTAFLTAKQLWMENIQNVGEEGVELRNKAQQLMRVLQYEGDDYGEEKMGYWYVNCFGDRRERLDKGQKVEKEKEKQVKREIKLTKVRQPQIIIKISKTPKETLNQTQQKSFPNPKNPPPNPLLYRTEQPKDQNIDRSNFNSSLPFIRSINTSNQDSLYSRAPPNKIVELNKMEYRKAVPKLGPTEAKLPFYGVDKGREAQEGRERCPGNCLQIKYECCCKKKIWTEEQEEGEKVEINQFWIRSPSARERSYTATQDNNPRNPNQGRPNRVCARVQKQPKIPNRSFESIQLKKPQLELNKQKKPNKVYMKDAHQNEEEDERINQKEKEKQKQKQKRREREKEIEKQEQIEMERIKQLQKIAELQKQNQIDKLKQIQLQKEQELARQRERIAELDRMREMEKIKYKQMEMEIIRSRENELELEMRREMEIEKERQRVRMREIEKMREAEEKREKAKERERQWEREEEKVRENTLLRKLKMQFSEICYQEPNDDERRVSEQIKQLEMKLSEIISHNGRMKTQAQQSHSPNAKVVKLNLTPSRSNLHRNMPVTQRSPTARPSIAQKSSRLLSKRIENAGRMG